LPGGRLFTQEVKSKPWTLEKMGKKVQCLWKQNWVCFCCWFWLNTEL